MNEAPPPPKQGTSRIAGWWRSVVAWASFRALWQAAHQEGHGKNSVAASIGIGVFIANTPLWGLHSAMCVVVARILRIHPLPMLAGTLVGLPPIGPALIAAAVWLGSIIVHGHAPAWEEIKAHKRGYWHLIADVALEWTIGSVLIGAALGGLAFGLAWLALRKVHALPATGAVAK